MPTYDEFGGIEVDDEQDEFGGVLVQDASETPLRFSDSMMPSLIGGQPSFLSEPPPMAATPREEALASRERRGPEFSELPAGFVGEEIPDPSRQAPQAGTDRLITGLSTAPIGLGTFRKSDGRTFAPGSEEMPIISMSDEPDPRLQTRLPTPTSQFIAALPEGKIKDLSAGSYNAAANLFNFFLSPAGVASLGIGSLPPIPQRALAAKFAYDMAMGAPEQLGAGDEAFKRGDIQAATEHWLGGAASLGVAGLAAGHAMTPIKLPAMERRAPPIIQEVVSTGDPVTAGSRRALPEITAEEVAPGVPREGISAEVAQPTIKSVPTDSKLTVAPEVAEFVTEYTKPPDEFRIVNASSDPTKLTTQKTGLALRSIADLNEILKVNNEARGWLTDFKKRKSEGHKPTAKEMEKYFTLAGRVQFPREVIETATNAGSWSEENVGAKGSLGERPLDWKKNPEVAQWLKDNADALKISLPDELKATAKPAEPTSANAPQGPVAGAGDPATISGGTTPATAAPIDPGGRVVLSGGDRFHSDISGTIYQVHNNGMVLDVIKDGTDYPVRVTLEDYANQKISPLEKPGQIPIEGKPSAVANPPPAQSGMTVEEAKTYLNRPGQIMGYDEQSLLDAQRKNANLKPETKPTPSVAKPTPATPVAETSGEMKPAPNPAETAGEGKSDWTSATEDIAEAAPESGKTTPPDPNIIEMYAGIPIPKFADRKMSPLDRVTTSHSGKLQKSFSEARLAQNEIKQAVPSERRQNAISIYREAGGDMAVLKDWEARAKQKWMRDVARDAQTLTPKEAGLLPRIESAYSTMETRGNTYDVLKSHVDNYVTHIWDVNRPGSGFGTGMLKQRFKFAKARTFKTFFEGDQAGFKPKTLAIGKLLPAYIHEMNRVIADRQAVRDLAKGTMPDGSPMVVPKGNVKVVDGPSGKAVLVSPKAARVADTSDYRVMADQPALSNWIWEGKDTDGKPVFVNADLAVHPDVYRRLTATLGQSAIRAWYRDPVSGAAQIPRAIVRGLDTAQSAMKREMFGLLAPFHQVQEGTHAIGHLVNPFFGLEKIDLAKNAKQVDAANHGLMLLPDRASSRVYLEGVGTQSSLLSRGIRKGGKVGEAISDVIDGYQDYLFHQYIPALKFKTYEAMVGRNTKLYAKELASGEMTLADVKLTSAEQANAAYGHLNYALLDRNPTIQHMIQLAALAPDFLEARVRFAGQGVKGIRSKVGHEQFKAIAILAAAQAGMAFVLSQLLGVPYDEEHPFEVIYKGRRYAMRSVPEDIFGLMKDTRQFVYSRVNPLTVKGGVQLATGLNYRGEKVTPTETMAELLAGYIPITARALPGVRSLTETGKRNPVTPLQQLAGSLGLRVSRYSPISETYKLAGEWMEKQKIPKDTGSYPVSQYQQLRYALEDGDLDRAADAYQELKKTMTSAKISTGFKQSINHPFTKSQTMDKQFSNTLTGYDKELYAQAIRARQNILKEFNAMRK